MNPLQRVRHIFGSFPRRRLPWGREKGDDEWEGKAEMYPKHSFMKKMKKKKRSSKTTDIVSYASKVSVNGVICVFVAHFRSSDTFESL